MSYLIVENRPVGFFSNFNLIAGSLNYIRENNIDKFYVFWQNPFYQDQNYNLFDKYFFQQQPIQEFTVQKSAFDLGIDINCENTITQPREKGSSNCLNLLPSKKLHDTLKHFNYFENKIYKNCKNVCAKKTKSLGVHVRQTDHKYHGTLLELEKYFDEIDKKINDYDNIFLATDEIKIIELFEQKYQNKIYFNKNIIRSDNSDPIHQGKYFHHREKLAIDVITDAISLSLCDEVIITSSNVISYVFMLNPDIKYSKIDWHIKHNN